MNTRERKNKTKDVNEMSDAARELNALADYVRQEGEVRRGHIMIKFGWYPTKASEMASACADLFDDIVRRGRRLVAIPLKEEEKKDNPEKEEESWSPFSKPLKK